jgi:hypothetical protein
MESEYKEIVPHEEQTEILSEIKELIDNKAGIHSVNVTDFKISKNISSGNGFSIVNKANVWKRDRAQVSANVLEPIINSIVYKFSEDPFEFDLSDGDGKTIEADGIFDREELSFQLSTTLREISIDGMSYILVYIDENGKIGFDRLNNFNVLYGDCKYADGKDCKQAIYVDKEKASGPRRSRDGLSKKLQTVLELKQNEIPVMTYWKKLNPNEVATYEIRGNEITGKVVQNISRIPVVRFYGKECFIEYEKSWRGLYYLVKAVMMTMDYELSLIQEKIATAPTELYIIAQETIGKNLDDWTRINDIPKAFRAYLSIDPKTGKQLPAPMPNNFILNIGELIESFNKHLLLVNDILGSSAGMPNAGEVVESVLLRKENKNTAVNEMIKNLLDSSWEICDLIMDFSGVKCEIKNGIFVKSKKQQDLEKLVAVLTAAGQNPLINAAIPLIAEKIDFETSDREKLLSLLAAAQMPDRKAMELEQQLAQMKTELDREKAVNEARLASAELLHQRQTHKNEMDFIMKEKDFLLKQKELELKIAQLQIEGGAAAAQIQQGQQKLEQEQQALNLKAEEIIEDSNIEREKIVAKALENIQR